MFSDEVVQKNAMNKEREVPTPHPDVYTCNTSMLIQGVARITYWMTCCLRVLRYASSQPLVMHQLLIAVAAVTGCLEGCNMERRNHWMWGTRVWNDRAWLNMQQQTLYGVSQTAHQLLCGVAAYPTLLSATTLFIYPVDVYFCIFKYWNIPL